jgi:hypothetical protein
MLVVRVQLLHVHVVYVHASCTIKVINYQICSWLSSNQQITLQPFVLYSHDKNSHLLPTLLRHGIIVLNPNVYFNSTRAKGCNRNICNDRFYIARW